jgi:hypothetical protein
VDLAIGSGGGKNQGGYRQESNIEPKLLFATLLTYIFFKAFSKPRIA